MARPSCQRARSTNPSPGTGALTWPGSGAAPGPRPEPASRVLARLPRPRSHWPSWPASGRSISSGNNSSRGQTSWLARQGSLPPAAEGPAGAASSWLAGSGNPFTSRRRWLPGKGKRRLALMPPAKAPSPGSPPNSRASCSPSQRLVGQVFTTTWACSNGPGGSACNLAASTWASHSIRLLRYRVSKDRARGD